VAYWPMVMLFYVVITGWDGVARFSMRCVSSPMGAEEILPGTPRLKDLTLRVLHPITSDNHRIGRHTMWLSFPWMMTDVDAGDDSKDHLACLSATVLSVVGLHLLSEHKFILGSEGKGALAGLDLDGRGSNRQVYSCSSRPTMTMTCRCLCT